MRKLDKATNNIRHIGKTEVHTKSYRPNKKKTDKNPEIRSIVRILLSNR